MCGSPVMQRVPGPERVRWREWETFCPDVGGSTGDGVSDKVPLFMRVHIGPQDGIDASLVASSLSLEPLQYV